jgi:hypothetical protein
VLAGALSGRSCSELVPWPAGGRTKLSRADVEPRLGHLAVYISPLMISELKRMVESSDIVKYVAVICSLRSWSSLTKWRASPHREDDAKWPKKNAQGKQELEIRVGSQHVSFEVRALLASGPPASAPQVY